MEKIKSILLALLAAVMIVSPMGNRSVNAAEKVKVYIFEAGGCPYCEAQIEYLKKLDSYNKKFVIVEKELYVDHVEWKEGKDYTLGKLVADAFQQAGFKDASYQGTPFVVISDIYAATTYTESLSDYIEKAYKDGDKDVVGCFESGGSDCLEGVTVTPIDNTNTTGSTENESSDVARVIVLIMIVGGIVALAVLGRKKVVSDDFEDEIEIEPKKEIVKEEKVAVKKTTSKKAEPKTEKKTSKSKSTSKKKNNK